MTKTILSITIFLSSLFIQVAIADSRKHQEIQFSDGYLTGVFDAIATKDQWSQVISICPPANLKLEDMIQQVKAEEAKDSLKGKVNSFYSISIAIAKAYPCDKN